MSAKQIDKAAGAIIGALIGDALGVGPHWFYDLAELRENYGDWIDTYLPPKSNRYHKNVKAGQNSQTGQVLTLLLQSVSTTKDYKKEHFTQLLDGLLDSIDGTPHGGLDGRYTDQAMRDLWNKRKVEKVDWSEQTGSYSDTSEAAIRSVVLCARYFNDLNVLASKVNENVQLTHVDPFIVSQSMAFALILGCIIRGNVDMSNLSNELREMSKRKEIPFTHAILVGEEEHFRGKEHEIRKPTKEVPFVDALLQFGFAYNAAKDEGIKIEPAYKVCQLYGLACTLGFMLPAAYYLIGKFPNDFTNPVLHAINGGGNNMMRAALTGALAGASVGLSNIPDKFIKGLDNHEQLISMAMQVAKASIE